MGKNPYKSREYLRSKFYLLTLNLINLCVGGGGEALYAPLWILLFTKKSPGNPYLNILEFPNFLLRMPLSEKSRPKIVNGLLLLLVGDVGDTDG